MGEKKQSIANDPLVLKFANAPDHIYEIAQKTNPTLAWAIETSRQIVEAAKE